MQRGNLSLFFLLQFRLLHHVWKDKEFLLFILLVDAENCCCSAFMGYFFMLCLSVVFFPFLPCEMLFFHFFSGKGDEENAMHFHQMQGWFNLVFGTLDFG